MKTKEQLIREAYGVHYEELKEFIDLDGWCRDHPLKMEHVRAVRSKVYVDMWRPIFLSRLEYNEGWTVVSDGYLEGKTLLEFLGKSYETYKCGGVNKVCTINSEKQLLQMLVEVTHIKEIPKSEPPLWI